MLGKQLNSKETNINHVLITGGASGLGLAITRKFAVTGIHKVFFTYCKAVDKAVEIQSEFALAEGIYCDFRDTDSLDQFVKRIPEIRPDVLINNALTSMTMKHFHQSDPAHFVESFCVNVLPTLKVTQQTIKEFRKRKFGKIVTILTSYLVNKPPIGLSEYVANKAYLQSLSRTWAAENARFGITSNCVSPSMMQTRLTSNLDQRQIEDVLNNHPLKRLVTPDEVADVVFYLAEASQQINGVNLLMNGGVDVV